MAVPVLTDEVVARLVGSEIAYMVELVEAFARHGEAELSWVDHVVAFTMRGTTHRAWNQALGLRTGDQDRIGRVVDWANQRKAPVRLEVVPSLCEEGLLGSLAGRGLCMTGFRSALYGVPAPGHRVAPAA